jgi:tetratricopeptide (TPR) repeat protein
MESDGLLKEVLNYASTLIETSSTKNKTILQKILNLLHEISLGNYLQAPNLENLLPAENSSQYYFCLFSVALYNFYVGDYRASLELLRRVPSSFIYSRHAIVKQCESLINQKNYEEPINLLRDAIEFVPLCKLLVCYQSTNQTELALATCKKILRIDHSKVYCKAWKYMIKEDYLYALDILKTDKEIDAGSLDTFYLISYCFLKLKRIKDAIGILNKILGVCNATEIYWELLGICYGEVNLQESFWCFSKCTLINPKRPENWYNLGVLYSKFGRPESGLLFSKANSLGMDKSPTQEFIYPIFDLSSFGKVKIHSISLDKNIPPAIITPVPAKLEDLDAGKPMKKAKISESASIVRPASSKRTHKKKPKRKTTRYVNSESSNLNSSSELDEEISPAKILAHMHVIGGN